MRRQRFSRIEVAYQDLVTFGQSVRAIREVVEVLLNEQLTQEIPRISDMLSNVFSALTRHSWYDRLVISEDTLPRLQMRVASSSDPIGNEDPTAVLNGQAESALDLVPYFAFSQTDDAPTEIYLVLLDDPTRAFDSEHIEILIERLHELGNHVQLIVASQETERFHAILPEIFDRESYAIIEPTSWSHDEGPKLEVRYE